MSGHRRRVRRPLGAHRVGVAAALACLLVLTGCGGAVDLEVPDLDSTQAAACADLDAALPSTLDDLAARETDPADAPGAAYGDPAITVTCGVGEPAGFDQFAQCQLVDGVGWFVPDDQMTDQPVEVTLTTAGYRPRVEVVVPAEYWPSGAATVTVELNQAVRDSVERVDGCR